MSSKFLLILSTAPDEKTAEALACGLVEKKLAACVNIIGGVRSVYRWKGKIEKAFEVIVVAKTTAKLAAEASRFIKSRHPYEVPEIISLSVLGGDKTYLDWITSSVGKTGGKK